MPVPTMIQTAGTRTKRRNHLKGPKAPENSLILNVKHLPNPYGKLEGRKEATHLERVQGFLQDQCSEKIARLVEKGRRAIAQEIPVVVVCHFGRDRSVAIARMIGSLFHCSRVYYVDRENPNNQFK